jgi:hypothetical protein
MKKTNKTWFFFTFVNLFFFQWVSFKIPFSQELKDLELAQWTMLQFEPSRSTHEKENQAKKKDFLYVDIIIESVRCADSFNFKNIYI